MSRVTLLTSPFMEMPVYASWLTRRCGCSGRARYGSTQHRQSLPWNQRKCPHECPYPPRAPAGFKEWPPGQQGAIPVVRP